MPAGIIRQQLARVTARNWPIGSRNNAAPLRHIIRTLKRTQGASWSSASVLGMMVIVLNAHDNGT